MFINEIDSNQLDFVITKNIECIRVAKSDDVQQTQVLHAMICIHLLFG